MEKRINKYLVGSDPEMFLQDKETKAIVSAIPYIPGDKHNPYQIPGLPEGCCIQVDNIMVEYCVPATDNAGQFFDFLEMCKNYTNSVIPSNLEVVVQASAVVEAKYLDHPKALEFGCEPDYNAWTDGIPNDSPCSNTNLRTAGGHIHVGYNNPQMIDSMDLVKCLDIFLGVPSIILDPDKERKKMYGKAGAFRFKNYGVEYRGLSNFWVKDLESIKHTFKAVEAAIDFFNNNGLERINDEMQLRIQTCINTGDEALAYELIQPLGLDKLLKKSAIFID